MKQHLSPCDITALMQIETYAPHLLTPHDRHCLRMHKAAPAVHWGIPAALAAVIVALVILAAWGSAA